jgi:hypothetical protein
LRNHLCQPIWNAFCEQAASAGVVGFPTAVELLDDRNTAAPVEWQMPDWEWVDPSVEQQTAQASIDAYMSDYQTELGARGKSWKNVFYQRAKEDRLRRQLGLLTPAEQQLAMVNANQNPQAQQPSQTGSGEMQGMGRLAFKNATKAITDVLSEMASGAISEARAKKHCRQRRQASEHEGQIAAGQGRFACDAIACRSSRGASASRRYGHRVARDAIRRKPRHDRCRSAGDGRH